MITQNSKNVDESNNSLKKNSLGFIATILFLGYLFLGNNQFNQFEIVILGLIYAFCLWFAFFSSFRKVTKEYSETINKIEELRKNQEIAFKRELR